MASMSSYNCGLYCKHICICPISVQGRNSFVLQFRMPDNRNKISTFKETFRTLPMWSMRFLNSTVWIRASLHRQGHCRKQWSRSLLISKWPSKWSIKGNDYAAYCAKHSYKKIVQESSSAKPREVRRQYILYRNSGISHLNKPDCTIQIWVTGLQRIRLILIGVIKTLVCILGRQHLPQSMKGQKLDFKAPANNSRLFSKSTYQVRIVVRLTDCSCPQPYVEYTNHWNRIW